MSQPENPPHITLVHGTFAPDADWVNEGSVIRSVIKERLGNEVVFDIFNWEGKNDSISRTKACTCLAERLEQSSKEYPNHSLFVIAHSHGGNIAREAIESQNLSRVAGLVCLATPFLTRTPWDLRSIVGVFHLVRSLIIATAVIGFIYFVSTSTLDALGNFIPYFKLPNWVEILRTIGLVFKVLTEAIGFICWAAIGYVIAIMWSDPEDSWLVQYQRKRSKELSETRNTSVDTFAIWFSADEAYRLLRCESGAGQILLSAWLAFYRTLHYSTIVIVAILGLIGFVWRLSQHASVFQEGDLALAGILFASAGGVAILTILVTFWGFVSVANWIVVSNRFSLGARGFFDSLMFRYSITQTPPYLDGRKFKTLIVAIPFYERLRQYFRLNLMHSQPYQSEQVASEISDWIRSKATTQTYYGSNVHF